MAYLPYGGVRLGDARTLPTDYTFTGQRLDAGLGLMHYGARFYSPRLGRFVSADTIVPEPGEPQALNRYAYAYNNPVIYIDPDGHLPGPWWLWAGLAIGGIYVVEGSACSPLPGLGEGLGERASVSPPTWTAPKETRRVSENPTGLELTKHYYAKGQRASAGHSRAVAIRTGGVAHYLQADYTMTLTVAPIAHLWYTMTRLVYQRR